MKKEFKKPTMELIELGEDIIQTSIIPTEDENETEIHPFQVTPNSGSYQQ